MDHHQWMRIAAEEYRRTGELLAALAPHDWSAPTECPGWDVRAMVAHLVGAAEATASIRESIRQARLGKRLVPDTETVHAMNEVQVRERADRTPAQLLVDLEDAARRGVRARSRIPRPVRALRVPFGPPLGTRPLGYLMDCIYTRDVWMHRLDVCRATGRSPVVDADHDGRIIADLVSEWATAHGMPFTLRLTGPAGGSWSQAPGGEQLELDALEFARLVSGRGDGAGLLAVPVPF